MNVLFFDLETTDPNPGTCGIVQLAAVYLSAELGKPRIVFNSLASPKALISDGAAAVHGITRDKLTYAAEEYAVAYNFMNLLRTLRQKGPLALSGYNIRSFDVPVLTRILNQPVPGGIPLLDLYEIVQRDKRLYDQGRKLGEVFETVVGQAPLDAHDAAADCLMCAEILKGYLSKFTERTLEQLTFDVGQPMLLDAFPFGKHQGKPLDEVPLDYLQWCYDKFEGCSPDLRYTLEVKLGLRIEAATPTTTEAV